MSIYPNNNNSPIHNAPASDFAIGAAPSLAINMSAVMRLVYIWMGLGLLATAVTALFIRSNEALMLSIASSGMMMGIAIFQLVLVVVLSMALNKLSPSIAGILFLLYSVSVGVTMSLLLYVYSGESVVMAFGTAAALFGAMTVFAFTTRMDLTQWRTFLYMGLIGLLVATLLNVFIFKSSGLDLILSYGGVLLFTGLTAYDTYQIKQMAESKAMESADNNTILKLSIFGALKLYLDFINLFLYLLRIFGRRD